MRKTGRIISSEYHFTLLFLIGGTSLLCVYGFDALQPENLYTGNEEYTKTIEQLIQDDKTMATENYKHWRNSVSPHWVEQFSKADSESVAMALLNPYALLRKVRACVYGGILWRRDKNEPVDDQKKIGPGGQDGGGKGSPNSNHPQHPDTNKSPMMVPPHPPDNKMPNPNFKPPNVGIMSTPHPTLPTGPGTSDAIHEASSEHSSPPTSSSVHIITATSTIALTLADSKPSTLETLAGTITSPGPTQTVTQPVQSFGHTKAAIGVGVGIGVFAFLSLVFGSIILLRRRGAKMPWGRSPGVNDREKSILAWTEATRTTDVYFPSSTRTSIRPDSALDTSSLAGTSATNRYHSYTQARS